MRILRVAAQNFRTLEDIEIEFTGYYCAISGKNNAGKSAVVHLIRHFLDPDQREFFPSESALRISFPKDLTQWCEAKSIRLEIEVELKNGDDDEVLFLVKRISEKNSDTDHARVKLVETHSDTGVDRQCFFDDDQVKEKESVSEIFKKLKSAKNIVVHNSVSPNRRLAIVDNTFTEVVEAQFSEEDRKKISTAQRTLQNKVKTATRQHKNEIDKLLGKLSETYRVELTSADRGADDTFGLQVKLNDKSVDVPLGDWGSGTQNRTRVLINLLEVIRAREVSSKEDLCTPIFVVEEPESFLHPSAQAEFGKVLRDIADEHKIQILATTHSPYMLNTGNSDSNILLERSLYRKSALRSTQRVETSGENWMVPFSEILGIVPDEFVGWERIFRSDAPRVLMVEGKIDVEYFEFIRENYPSVCPLDINVKIVSYNGKDALKNIAIIKFLLKMVDRSFITFDLDSKKESEKYLQSINLEEGKNFCSVGVDKPGQRDVEGLLPEGLRSKVYSENPDLVTALGSAITSEKNEAKRNLKGKLLAEFKKSPPPESDLSEFRKLFTRIERGLNK